MSQSLARLHVHLVFSTKHRRRDLVDALRDALHGYIAVILRDLGCRATLVNSVEDHIHVLFELGRSTSVADVVKEVKMRSSRWIKEQDAGFADFAWRSGYGAFTVSESNVRSVARYVSRQREHHRRHSFEDEFRAILERHGVAFDERYVWD